MPEIKVFLKARKVPMGGKKGFACTPERCSEGGMSHCSSEFFYTCSTGRRLLCLHCMGPALLSSKICAHNRAPIQQRHVPLWSWVMSTAELKPNRHHTCHLSRSGNRILRQLFSQEKAGIDKPTRYCGRPQSVAGLYVHDMCRNPSSAEGIS